MEFQPLNDNGEIVCTPNQIEHNTIRASSVNTIQKASTGGLPVSSNIFTFMIERVACPANRPVKFAITPETMTEYSEILLEWSFRQPERFADQAGKLAASMTVEAVMATMEPIPDTLAEIS